MKTSSWKREAALRMQPNSEWRFRFAPQGSGAIVEGNDKSPKTRALRCGTLALLCMAAAVAWAGEKPGVIPLANPGEYPYHLERDDFSLGVKVLTRGQVEKLFASDLNRGYVVLEVAVYPAQGGVVKLSEGQFLLRRDQSSDYARATKPADAARVLQKSNAKRGGRDVTLYPEIGVGYSSGGGPYYNRGWHTSAGVGVGIGSSEPEASTDADRKTMETELTEKGLPVGTSDKAVAGYLYFPLSVVDPARARLMLDFVSDDTVAGAEAARLDLYD
jgi:hypothetical protein